MVKQMSTRKTKTALRKIRKYRFFCTSSDGPWVAKRPKRELVDIRMSLVMLQGTKTDDK